MLPARIGVAVAAAFGSLALGALLAPHLVDVEAYKPAMIAAVKEATGRELVIEGPMKLSVFPRPRVSARKVHFGNAVGAAGAQMVDVAWVGVSPSWSALLLGRVEVGRLTLYKPTIVLETDADGRPNWEFRPGAGAAQAPGAPSSGLHLAIGRLRIVQGTLAYTDPRTGRTLKAGQVDVTASVGSLEGPFAVVGSATVNGVPLSLDLHVGGPSTTGHDLALTFKVQSGTLDFRGQVSRLSADADVSGKVSVATAALGDFVAAIGLAAGRQMPALDAVAGRVAFDSTVDFKAGRLALPDVRLAVGGETASGSVVLTGGSNPSLRARASLPRLDVDKWLAPLSGPGLSRPEMLSAKTLAALSPFPPEWAVSLEIAAHEVLYAKGIVRDLALAVDIADGAISLPGLDAILPGELALKVHAAPAGNARLAGELSLAGPRLRETLAWLGIDTSGVPADRLQSVSVKARIASTGSGLVVSDVAMDIDGQRATGSGSITLGVPLTVAAAVQLDRFDLDAYLPKPVTSPAPPGPPGPTTAPPVAAAPVLPTVDKTAPVLGLKAKIAKLVWRGEALNGVDVDASIQGNLLKVAGLRIGDLLGARLDLKGQVADPLSKPRFDVTFNASMPDTDKLLVYAGLPKFINGKIGASTASGAVAGTREALALRNATATVAGATVRATGSLVLGDRFAFDFPAFSLQADDASRLVSLATGRSQSGLGALAAAGAFKGNERRAAFDGGLTAMGTPMTGRIEANLGERPNIVANLRVPGTLDVDRWLGVAEPAPGAPAASGGGRQDAATIAPAPARVSTGKAIDLSGLRAFDATLNLETSAIEVASLKVAYADMAATLRNGVFRISRLTGQFYGGAVDFAGTVDASKAALAIDMTGSLQGIYLGELLRGAAGNNVYGNEHLTVAVDGKLSILDISVSGRGSSAEQIRDSLTGRGRLTGILYPSVAGGSLGFASFATGLGSIFSTEMGFASAALAGFINAQSTIEGELTIAGGVLTLSNHLVKGQNAIALVNSHNSFVAATTDTTIALDTGRRGPADYVLTVRGPVSSPTWRAGRGPGNN